jgi:molybdopterin-guanine dinucleotide biosynthesis protein A
VGAALDAIVEFSNQTWQKRTLRAGILIGGDATRMGRSKQLLELEGRTFVERLAEVLIEAVGEPVLLGSGSVPGALAAVDRLPDVPGLEGPIAGLTAALRWDPGAAWLITACDQPLLEPAAVAWLLGQRSPGRWALLPRTKPGTVEPLLAVYEPQAAALLADAVEAGVFGPQIIAGHPRVASPVPPPDLIHCWRSIDTPEDYREISG